MQEQRVIFPKTTPQWLRERVREMEYQIENLIKKQERTSSQLWKNQEDFQDLLDLVERIAEDREPEIKQSCQTMVKRFITGFNEDDDVS